MPELTRRSLLAATTAAAAATTLPARATDTATPSLKGKSMFITGASSGFGRIGAEHYARQGAKVFATMRNLPRTEADELIELAARDKLDITVLPLDVLSDEQVAAAVRDAEAMAGGIRSALRAGTNRASPVDGRQRQRKPRLRISSRRGRPTTYITVAAMKHARLSRSGAARST